MRLRSAARVIYYVVLMINTFARLFSRTEKWGFPLFFLSSTSKICLCQNNGDTYVHTTKTHRQAGEINCYSKPLATYPGMLASALTPTFLLLFVRGSGVFVIAFSIEHSKHSRYYRRWFRRKMIIEMFRAILESKCMYWLRQRVLRWSLWAMVDQCEVVLQTNSV